MGREEVREGFLASLLADSTLVGLLGVGSSANALIYSAWPQQQPLLSAIEPTSEGWMTVREENTEAFALQPSSEPSNDDTAHEYFTFVLDIYGTALALADKILTRIDLQYHWRIDQQRATIFGPWYLVFSRRVKVTDGYDDKVKLNHKSANYELTCILSPAEP